MFYGIFRDTHLRGYLGFLCLALPSSAFSLGYYWRFGLFPSEGSQWLLVTIPAVFPGDMLPSHHGPGIPSRQEGRGMQSFLPTPRMAFDVMESWLAAVGSHRRWLYQAGIHP